MSTNQQLKAETPSYGWIYNKRGEVVEINEPVQVKTVILNTGTGTTKVSSIVKIGPHTTIKCGALGKNVGYYMSPQGARTKKYSK